jgi:hypothetical protein
MSDVSYDFYRCRQCQRLLTRPEVAARLVDGSPCACGSLQVQPANLPWWGWFLPRVWTFAIARLRGRA